MEYFGISVGSEFLFQSRPRDINGASKAGAVRLADLMMSHWFDSPEIVSCKVKIGFFHFNTSVIITNNNKFSPNFKPESCDFPQVFCSSVVFHCRCCWTTAMCVGLCAGLDGDLLAVIPAFSRHPSLKHLMLGKNFNIKGRYGPRRESAAEVAVKMMMNVFPLLSAPSGCSMKSCRNWFIWYKRKIV